MKLTIVSGKKAEISFILNGSTVSGYASARVLLSDFIRDVLGKTGTHVGCEHGVCGACTVRLEGRAVRSCLTLAVQVEGKRIETVEGLEELGRLSRLQEQFVENSSVQCGFCTPGIIMRAVELLEKTPNPSEDEIRWGISGNLCRCTGYNNIVKAIKYASAKMRGAELPSTEPEFV